MTSGRRLESRAAVGHDTEVELFSVAGLDGYLREVNDRFARLLGMSPTDLQDRSILELVHPDDLESIVAGLAALEAGTPEVLLENRFKKSDGGWVYLQWVVRTLPGTDLWWASGRDTTAFHRLLAEGADLRARLDLAIGQATAAMWEFDVRRGQFSWEPQAGVVLGVSVEALPKTVLELAATVHPDDASTVVEAMKELVGSGITDVAIRVRQEAGVRYLSLRGKVLDRDHRGRPARAVGLLFDVTNEKAMEEQMLRMIMSDALTGAPNRRAFDQALRSEWRRCKRAREPLSIVMIDIDDFKKFNDTFGHLVGDEVLCAVSRALASNLHREGDSVARFGGEEFAAVLPNVDHEGALTVANRLVEAVRTIAMRQAPGWGISISIGTASWHIEEGPLKSAELLSRADEALYVAKGAGKDRAVSYEDSLADRAMSLSAVEHGLAADEFELYYQPIIALQTDEVAGFEALVRWNRPGCGFVQPDAFIPIVETSPLISDLGRWVLERATSQLAAWLDQGLDVFGPLRIAVNASGRHIASPEIVSDVARALADSGLPPHRLELELTETALVDGDLLDTHLAQVRALGATVSIDDFGTGYTSIGQLPHLPVDTLKIDRSFIASDDPRQRELISLMIAAAHAFDLRVVAEGIETPAILQDLRALGCDDAQGYLVARPMAAREIPAWLAQWPTQRAAISAGAPVEQADELATPAANQGVPRKAPEESNTAVVFATTATQRGEALPEPCRPRTNFRS